MILHSAVEVTNQRYPTTDFSQLVVSACQNAATAAHLVKSKSAAGD